MTWGTTDELPSEKLGLTCSRPQGRELKTIQLNMRVTPTIKQLLENMAIGLQMSAVEVVEVAILRMAADRDVQRDAGLVKRDWMRP